MKNGIYILIGLLSINLNAKTLDFNQKQEASPSIPQGKFTYELYFAGYGGRMSNLEVEVEIVNNHITIYNNSKSPLGDEKVLLEGLLIKHISGKWVIAEDENQKNAEEVGGCTAGPIPISFEKKVIEWC